jgi:hypothetical protein
MSVVFTMSTDAQPNFSFGRTVGPRVKRLLSEDATLGPLSPTQIPMTYVIVDNLYVYTKVFCRSLANCLMV